MHQNTFIFIGRSGCGKGTQAKLLAEALKERDPGRDTFMVQSGEEFRRFIQGDSHTKKLAKQIYMDGKLEPEFLAILMWANLFAENFDGKDHIIIDGTPREIREVYILDSVFPFYGIKKPIVIYLNLTEDEATKRLIGRGRLDDNERDIKMRLKWFNTDVIPVVDFYRNNPAYNFIEINSNRTIEEVHADILEKVGLVG